MKNALVLILSFVCLATVTFAQQDPKAAAILDAMSKKYKDMPSFRAKFVYTMEAPGNIKETSEGEIIVKGSKFILRMGGQEIINNGTTVWTYIKDANEVNVSNYEPGENDLNPTKIYTMYKKGYKYMFLEEKTENGKTYEVVDLIPEDKKPQIFKVRMEINKKDKTLKSWKIFEKNGNKYYYTVKDFQPDYKIEDNAFTFDVSKYKGVEVIELR
ncbi:MAG: LolA family protein [Cytophagaceae bacterium]